MVRTSFVSMTPLFSALKCWCFPNRRCCAGLLAVFLAVATTPKDAQADRFPVLIQHQYGETTVQSEPSRIVSLSFIGHDFLLALGRPPHALRKWFGPHPYGIWPWAQEALGEATPIVMQGEIDIEAIAAMQPDLIVGQWSGMTKREYQLLSRIAPTVPPQLQYGDYGTPWQEILRTLGRATGRLDQAEEIIAEIDARFHNIRQAHPEWLGASSVMVWAGQNGAYSARDIRGQFIQALGFEVPDAINTRASFNNYYVLIPPEDLSPIDVDALIWLDAGGSVSRLQRMPLRPTLRAYAEGREIYADLLLSAALSHSSPLSLNYALDRLVPLLEAAMDGDPATTVTSTAKAGLQPEGF